MKKHLLLLIVAFSFNACSIEEVQESENSPVQEIDALFEVDGCTIEKFEFGQSGKIEVRHNRDSLYVLIEAYDGFTITATSLHLAAAFSDFPTVGKGNLQVKNMEFQESFDPAVDHYTFQFPVSNFEGVVSIASYTEFLTEGGKEAFWAGDIMVQTGKWAYFDYMISEHPYNAGGDKSRDIGLTEAQAIGSWDEVRKLFTYMLDPGVPEGQFVGSFNPTIDEIIERFNAEGTGVYSTIYTIGEGECNDSVILTVNVVDDISL